MSSTLARTPLFPRIQQFYALTKPRVVSLIVFTAVIGMFLATPGMVPVGILFAAYNGFAALAALFIPKLAEMLGRRKAHLVCLWFGALGLVSIRFIEDPRLLLVSMIGVGIAWAAILSLPYAMLSQAVPMKKMGIYMGIFNFFIVIPQSLAASVLGILVRVLFGGHSINALALGGLLLVLAGLATLRVDDHEDRD